jgi:hypothetical protein
LSSISSPSSSHLTQDKLTNNQHSKQFEQHSQQSQQQHQVVVQEQNKKDDSTACSVKPISTNINKDEMTSPSSPPSPLSKSIHPKTPLLTENSAQQDSNCRCCIII